MVHIDPLTSVNQYMRMKSVKAYKRANLEGQKINQKLKQIPQLTPSLFSNTVNNMQDLLSLNPQ